MLEPSLNCLSSSFSSKASLPMTLICLMRAVSPSWILMVTATRLRSSGETVDWTSTPYLPRAKYCRLSSCSMRSRTEGLKTRPSASPTSLRPSVSASVSMSLLPTIVISATDGRSCTQMTSTEPSRSTRTSLKNPVPYSVRMMFAVAASVVVSPTFTGR